MAREVITRECKNLNDFISAAAGKSNRYSGDFDIVLEESAPSYFGGEYSYDVNHKYVSRMVGSQANLVVYNEFNIILDRKSEIKEWLDDQLELLQKRLDVMKVRSDIQSRHVLRVYSAKDDRQREREQD
jgi:hypothetical protein